MALTLERAQEMIAVCEAKSREKGYKMAIVIVDSSGNLKAAIRMDGSGFLSAEIAQSKAYTAAAYRRNTEEMIERFQNRPLFAASMSALTAGRVLYGRGGYVLKEDGEAVGAIGVSGGTEDEDCEVARAGLAVWQTGR